MKKGKIDEQNENKHFYFLEKKSEREETKDEIYGK